jgi:alpha-L-fucosidase
MLRSRSASLREIADYHQNAENFNPTAYNPREWATLAKSLGVQYVILTTKHHDGYALFPTKTSNFSSKSDRPDLVEQFVEAMREADLKVGFYFSLIDWHQLSIVF